MSPLFSSFFSAVSCSLFFAALAPTVLAASSPIEIKALSREIELHQQSVQTLKVNQELIDERLSQLETQFNQFQKEIDKLNRALARVESSRSTEASSGQLPSGWSQWRAQTDQNLIHLQQGLQALAKAMNQSSEPAPATTTKETKTKADIYVVQSGDSLEKIAKKYQTTVQALTELNGLKSSKIWSGQKLKIPTP